MKRLIIIRGLPGSGKTTLAQQLAERYKLGKCSVAHYEADMFFTNNGEYVWVQEQVGNAHAWCQEKVCQAMQLETDVIIVTNTFTRRYEMAAYQCMAKLAGYFVEYVECKGEYGSIHGVPEEQIALMKARWEPLEG